MGTMRTWICLLASGGLVATAGCVEDPVETETAIQAVDDDDGDCQRYRTRSTSSAGAPDPDLLAACDILDEVGTGVQLFGLDTVSDGNVIGRNSPGMGVSTVNSNFNPPIQKTCAEVTAGNGSGTLSFKLIGFAIQEGPIITFFGVEHLESGTGDYENASGTLNYSGSFDFTTNEGNLTENGEICDVVSDSSSSDSDD